MTCVRGRKLREAFVMRLAYTFTCPSMCPFIYLEKDKGLNNMVLDFALIMNVSSAQSLDGCHGGSDL